MDNIRVTVKQRYDDQDRPLLDIPLEIAAKTIPEMAEQMRKFPIRDGELGVVTNEKPIKGTAADKIHDSSEIDFRLADEWTEWTESTDGKIYQWQTNGPFKYDCCGRKPPGRRRYRTREVVARPTPQVQGDRTMRYRIRLLLLAAMFVAACSAARASEPSPMRKATKTPWPIKWYIPPEEGPVVGNQNGWFVTPQDILPGAFTLSGKVDNVTGDSFEMTPNSVWGRYRFKITRTGPADQPTADLKLRNVVSVRDIHFTDLSKLTDENTLLFGGTLKTIGPDRKSFTAEIDFNDGPLICRLDLIHAEENAPSPDIRSMHYGPHWQHTMDIYYPKDRGDGQLPIILYIHGGGWGALDKQGAARSVPGWTELGFAVVSVNYRFVSNANEYPEMSPPVAAPLYDAARALQHLRYHAKELGLDGGRIAVTGGSAGGATTCWLALRDDLADPDSPDPIARQSTRVTCVFPMQAQTSLDPQQMRDWIPQITYGAHAFFTSDQMKTKDKTEQFEYFLAHREEILPWIEEFSAYEWASADDPPMLHCYGGQKDVIPALDAGNATHHPKFGEHLHKRLKELGVESYYWADNVKCEEPRYDGWSGTRRFVCDHMGVPLSEN